MYIPATVGVVQEIVLAKLLIVIKDVLCPELAVIKLLYIIFDCVQHRDVNVN